MSPSDDFWDTSRWTPSTSSYSPRPSSSLSVPSSAGAFHHAARLGRAGQRGARGPNRRRAPLSTIQRSGGRWEKEVARSVGSSEGHAQHSRNRTDARKDMQCAGAKVAEFFETTGSGVTPAEAELAQERANQTIQMQKADAQAREEEQMQHQARRAAARQARVGHARQEHETRIALEHEAAKKAAKAAEEEQEAAALRDILTLRVARAERQRRDEDQRRGAELAALADRIQMPKSRVEFDNRLPSPRPFGYNDDEALRSLLVGSPSRAGMDDDALRSLCNGSTGMDDMLLQGLLQTPTNDVQLIHKLMGMPQTEIVPGPSPYDKDAQALKRFMGGDDDAALNQLLRVDKDLNDLNAIQSLMGKEPLQASRDNLAFQQLMGNVTASQAQDASALRHLMCQQSPRRTQTQLDDNAMHHLLGGNSPQSQDVAALNKLMGQSGGASQSPLSQDAAALNALMGQSPTASQSPQSQDAAALLNLMGQSPNARLSMPEEMRDTQNLQSLFGGAAPQHVSLRHYQPTASSQEMRDTQNLQSFLGGAAPQQVSLPPHQPAVSSQEMRDTQNLQSFLGRPAPQQVSLRPYQPAVSSQDALDTQNLQRFLAGPAQPPAQPFHSAPCSQEAMDMQNLGRVLGSTSGHAAPPAGASYAQEARDAQNLERFLGGPVAPHGVAIGSLGNAGQPSGYSHAYVNSSGLPPASAQHDDNAILNLMR